MNGIGGDSFWLIREPSGRVRAIMGAGRAGAKATRQFYRDAGHHEIPSRGPLAALLLAIAYGLLAVAALEWGLARAGIGRGVPVSPAMEALLAANVAALLWRLAARALFTAREFGPTQGLLAIPRVVVSNTVAIVAARRALVAYVRALRGARIAWDKTEHTGHPAAPLAPLRAGAG